MYNVLVLLQLGNKTMFQFFVQWFLVGFLISVLWNCFVTKILKNKITRWTNSTFILHKKKMNIPETSVPRIIVIGGGFAGISFIKKLQKEKVQIVLFDRHNYHTFQPLLYQVSTADESFKMNLNAEIFKKFFCFSRCRFAHWRQNPIQSLY